MPRLRARIAAWLVWPPVCVTMPATSRVAQHHRLRREQLIGHHDQRAGERLRAGLQNFAQDGRSGE